jgi:hypothetical protein
MAGNPPPAIRIWRAKVLSRKVEDKPPGRRNSLARGSLIAKVIHFLPPKWWFFILTEE